MASERRHTEVRDLLQRLVACDTSNPPGHETQAGAIVEAYLLAAGLECERVAKDPQRANLIARLPGRDGGPSLAFRGHSDVVRATRGEWSVEPFAGIERDGAIWGRRHRVALAALAREGFQRPP